MQNTDINSEAHTLSSRLLGELEMYEYLLFERLDQTSLDALVVLQAQWEGVLGHSPEAIRVTEALQDFIECLIYLDDTQHHQVEQAYLELVRNVQLLEHLTLHSPGHQP